MTELCIFSKCVKHATQKASYLCTGCPPENSSHEDWLCGEHLGMLVRNQAQCSYCHSAIRVTSYTRLTEAGYQGNGVVEQRITDADRNRTIELLGEAFAVGKLTKDEFDLRADRASVAKVQSDLDRELSDVKSSGPMWMETEQQGNNLVRYEVWISVLVAICIVAGMVAILV